jgi:hypothetical protein
MRRRRFTVLAALLVTLNLGLWVVPQGLALQRVVVATLFGKNLVRADVTENNGNEWRIARGVVVSNNNALQLLTIQESDSKVEAISTSSSTKVTGGSKPLTINKIKPGWHVLVTWLAPDGAADQVVVEKK